MRKLARALHLVFTVVSIVGCILFYNKASTELQYEQHFPGKEEESSIHYV